MEKLQNYNLPIEHRENEIMKTIQISKLNWNWLMETKRRYEIKSVNELMDLIQIQIRRDIDQGLLFQYA